MKAPRDLHSYAYRAAVYTQYEMHANAPAFSTFFLGVTRRTNFVMGSLLKTSMVEILQMVMSISSSFLGAFACNFVRTLPV